MKIRSSGNAVTLALFVTLASAHAAIFLTGCSATGQQFVRPEPSSNGAAVIYLYRPDQYMGGARSIPISIDNVEAGQLRNAGFLRILTTPGHHSIRPSSGASGLNAPDLELDVPSNRILYVRYNIIGKPISGISASTATSSMTVVGDKEAIGELTKLRESR